jgi:hypothetical protein
MGQAPPRLGPPAGQQGGYGGSLAWCGDDEAAGSSGSVVSHGGDRLWRFLQQCSGKGRVRSGPIDDAVHEREELTG